MSKYYPLILIFFLMNLINWMGCKPSRDLETVDQLDLNKYAGKWYEVARLPNSFEKGLKCISATYSLKENGKIEVRNAGVKIKNGNQTDIKGSARVPDPMKPGQLKVTFFWPFAGDYYVISVDENYQYALVGTPSRDFLWILSRSPKMPETDYEKMVSLAKEKQFDTSRLIRVTHDC